MDEFVKNSVKQTVQYNYNDNNTAAMRTFDMIQEEVGTVNHKDMMKTIDNKLGFYSSWSAVVLMDQKAGSSQLTMSMISMLVFRLPSSTRCPDLAVRFLRVLTAPTIST